MTIGNINDDFRHTVNTPDGPIPNVGTFYKKSWVGDDAPKMSNSSIPTPRPPRRARPKKGEHAYSMLLTSGNNKLVLVRRPVGAPYWSTAGGELVFNPESGWLANDEINLIGKLKSQINGSDFDMSVFAGTSHQSLRMIGDTAIQLAKAFREIKRGQLADAAKTLTGGSGPHKNRPATRTMDEMSKRTLELRYGWMPLLQDMKEGAEFVAQQVTAPMVQRYRVSLKKAAIIPPYTNGPDIAHGYRRVTLIAVVSENPSLIAKLGLQDPENLMWEATPWSFVADWVLPIGDYLSARSFAQKLQGTFIYTIKTFGYNAGYTMHQPGWSCEGAEGSYAKHVGMRRIITSSINVPMPVVKPLAQVASWAHAINGIALFAQQTAKMVRDFRR